MTARVPTWVVTVSHEDGLWVAVVDGLPGGAADMTCLDDLEVEVRDLISGLADVDPDGFAIEWYQQAS